MSKDLPAHADHAQAASKSIAIGLAFAVVGAIAFSGKAIIVKLAYRYGVDAVTLIMYRMLFALPLFVMLSVWASRGRPALHRRDWMVIAGLGFTGYYWVLVLAIRDAGTEMPALIVGLIPLWVMLLGKPGHLRWTTLAPGLLLTAAGLFLMSRAVHAGAGADAASPLPHYARGLALSVLAMACWTAFSLLNAAWLRRHPDVSATDWANWLGVATGLGGLALALGLGTPLPQLMAQPGWPLFALVVLGIGFGSSWLATILWNLASQRLAAHRAAHFSRRHPLASLYLDRWCSSRCGLVLLATRHQTHAGDYGSHCHHACKLCHLYPFGRASR